MNKNRLVLPTNFTLGDNLTYLNINDAFESINRFNEAYECIHITQLELRTLRDNGLLIPGAQYRIIDYNGDSPLITTAGHMFDIIIIAIDEYTLSTKASAALHDGEEYFKDCNLSLWEISFELGKTQVSSENLILYKTDIYSYEAAVDFEDYYEYDGEFEYEGNIYYKFVKREPDGDPNIYILTDTLDFTEVSLSNPYTPIAELRYEEGEYVTIDYHTSDLIVFSNAIPYSYISYMKDEFNNECYYDFKNVLFKRYYIRQTLENLIDLRETYLGIKFDDNEFYEIDDQYFINVYTFGYTEDATLTGLSFNNLILPASRTYFPNNITFGPISYNNTIFKGSINNSFGDQCYNNIICSQFINNTFGNKNRDNTFGNLMCNNSFGGDVIYNSFGNYIHGNTFNSQISLNSFGNHLIGNTFSYSIASNSFGNYITSNSFGYCIEFNTFGNYITYNSFGNIFKYNTVENNINCVTVGNNILHAKFLSGLTFDSATTIDGILTRVSYCQYIGKNSAGEVIIKNPLD